MWKTGKAVRGQRFCRPQPVHKTCTCLMGFEGTVFSSTGIHTTVRRIVEVQPVKNHACRGAETGAGTVLYQ